MNAFALLLLNCQCSSTTGIGRNLCMLKNQFKEGKWPNCCCACAQLQPQNNQIAFTFPGLNLFQWEIYIQKEMPPHTNPSCRHARKYKPKLKGKKENIF